MQERLEVYQRTGEPCPRCGRPIRRIVIGGRATHFCSWCQRLPAADRAGAAAILRAATGARPADGPPLDGARGEGSLGRRPARRERAAAKARAERHAARRRATRRAAEPASGPAARARDGAGRRLTVSLLRLVGVTREIGTFVILDEINAAIALGDRIGLVGPNGAGKTTLLRIAAGLDEPDRGEVQRRRA